MNKLFIEYIDIVQGTQGYIRRILKVRGCSDATIADVMQKIEAIIEHSGKLGRAIQLKKDSEYLRETKLELERYRMKGEA